MHILDAFPAIKLPWKYTVLRTCWGSDPLHRGSYSYISAESSTSDVETLSQPLVPFSPQVNVLCDSPHQTWRLCPHQIEIAVRDMDRPGPWPVRAAAMTCVSYSLCQIKVHSSANIPSAAMCNLHSICQDDPAYTQELKDSSGSMRPVVLFAGKAVRTPCEPAKEEALAYSVGFVLQ